MKGAIGTVAACAALLWTASASAQELTSNQHKEYASPQHFAIEGRATLYRPEIDSEPGLVGTPYASTYGQARYLMPSFEVDWQAYRIPHLGTIGLGFGAGTLTRSAPAAIQGTAINSGMTTSLQMIPMYLVAVLRTDVVARELGVPLVPYVKGGLGLGLWFATTEAGLSRTRDAAGAETSVGRGATWGLHGALGVMLLLDFFDKGTARNFDNSMGVNHTYLFAELTRYHLTGLGQKNALNLGDTALTLGLAFEF